MISNSNALRVAALVAAAAALAACGGGGGTSVTPPAPQPSFASSFGAGFGTDFAASANSTPAPITGNELNPVSLTGTPSPFPSGTSGTN